MLKIEFNEKNKVIMNIIQNENILLLNDNSIYDFIAEVSIMSSIVENLNNLENLLLINLSSYPRFCNEQFYSLNLNKENEYSIFETIVDNKNRDFFKNKFFNLGLKKENLIELLKKINKNIDFSNKPILIGIDISNIENIDKLLDIIKEMNKKNITFILSANEIKESINSITQHKLILGNLHKFKQYEKNTYIYNNKIVNKDLTKDLLYNSLNQLKLLNYNDVINNFEQYILNKQMVNF